MGFMMLTSTDNAKFVPLLINVQFAKILLKALRNFRKDE